MDVRFEGNTATGTEEWLTPPELIHSLGVFDLDPCSPTVRPWDTAKKHYDIVKDGLKCKWKGFVWCNPPYGRASLEWIRRMALHNNGILLVFARTETKIWQDEIFRKATCLFFLDKRIRFCDVHGNPAKSSAGAPSVLVGYGKESVRRLKKRKDGYLVILR